MPHHAILGLSTVDRLKKVIGVMWYGGWGGGWFLMTVIMVMFWGLLIAGIIALTGAGRSHRSGPPSSGESGRGGRRAEDLLAERFARGEIDEDEYKRRLTLLREHR